jgi:hypothetical protein
MNKIIIFIIVCLVVGGCGSLSLPPGWLFLDNEELELKTLKEEE